MLVSESADILVPAEATERCERKLKFIPSFAAGLSCSGGSFCGKFESSRKIELFCCGCGAP